MPTPVPAPLKLTPHIGTEVTGDRRYPRADLEQEFDSQILGSNGATLFGLRRIGKSSEAAACCERLQAKGMAVIKEDAQGMTSEAQLLLAILAKLPAGGSLKQRLTTRFLSSDALTQGLRDALGKFTGKVEDVQAYFGTIADLIETALEANDKVVVVIDEFPWLCRSILQADAAHGKERVDRLLAVLRKWRNKGMRMLLMGSIGIIALGRQYQLDLSHLNDLQPLHVPPLTADEARALCEALVLGSNVKGWTPAHTEALMTETGALYPIMIQKGFQVMTFGNRAVALDRVADLFAEKVRPDLDAAYYTQFDQRIKLYANLPAPHSKLTVALLDKVFDAAQPVSREELSGVATGGRPEGEVTDADIGEVLNMLREDGFLAVRVNNDGTQTWRVASDLVRSWRRQRRGATRR